LTGGSWPTYTAGSVSWYTYSFPVLGDIAIPTGITLPSFSFSSGSWPVLNIGSLTSWGGVDWAANETPSEAKVWALKVGGSDAQVTFYPYPVYCAGNAAGSSNMKVYTGASGSNHTRGTWFYRPVKAQGVDHGWV
jgi:hypothetical protein